MPVKDYIVQSAHLRDLRVRADSARRPSCGARAARVALLLALLLAAAFIANIVYVATARTTLVVMAVLLVLFGLRQFGWRGAIGACLLGGVLAGAVWVSSPYLRERVSLAVQQVRTIGARRRRHSGRAAARISGRNRSNSSPRRR